MSRQTVQKVTTEWKLPKCSLRARRLRFGSGGTCGRTCGGTCRGTCGGTCSSPGRCGAACGGVDEFGVALVLSSAAGMCPTCSSAPAVKGRVPRKAINTRSFISGFP